MAVRETKGGKSVSPPRSHISVLSLKHSPLAILYQNGIGQHYRIIGTPLVKLRGKKYLSTFVSYFLLPRIHLLTEDIAITFNDVKGVDEAKDELLDVVEFLRDPDRFSSLGGKMPHGVLLVGEPGVGKTLLAKAVAGEAGVPFFHASGSEFDEVFVGTGKDDFCKCMDYSKTSQQCN